MRIAIDAMGGDFAPEPIVAGALEALLADPDLSLTLVGDQDRIEPLLHIPDDAMSRLVFDHTTEVVGMDESPAKAMRSKPNSSINRCWSLLAEGKVEGLVSAGNTGAVVAGGLRTRRFLKNILRPGIAVTLPTLKGWTIILDVGANVHPKPEHLFQYAVMGSIFAKQLFNVDRPSVGLLNVGAEQAKGNSLAKETETLFQKSNVHARFHGNVEGRDIYGGLVDVIVCDGFVGNIVLKTCEGLVEFLMKSVGKEVLSVVPAEHRDPVKLALYKMQEKYHYSEFGGAPLLGIDGACLICHGSSDARAIRNAVRAAKRYGTINRAIVQELGNALATAADVEATAVASS